MYKANESWPRDVDHRHECLGRVKLSAGVTEDITGRGQLQWSGRIQEPEGAARLVK